MQALKSLGLAAMIALLSSPTGPTVAQVGKLPGSPMRCNGFNLLDKLAATDPALHARVVADAEALENGKAVFWRLERPGVAHLDKGGAFIAVGALHLPGKTGLVALLRDAGYTATAIE